MPTNDERREVAARLRGMSGDTAGLSDGEFIDLPGRREFRAAHGMI